MLYTLGRPLNAVAVSPAQTKKTIIVIPDGAVVEIPHDAPECGLVEAIWEGKSIEVFVEDVLERGSIVGAAHSS
jgi:hypothetical protein